MPYRLALVGFGQIARRAHWPALQRSPHFEIVATVDPQAAPDDAVMPNHFPDLESLLTADIGLDAVALCVPPFGRAALARRAIEAGLHVLLEKPPGVTLSEVTALAHRAVTAGVTLHASWHARHAAAVDAARDWLKDRAPRAVEIEWREDVRVFHPGQQWIWAPGGLGVFDPGINALSIATAILPRPFALRRADLEVPSNAAMPIAATLSFLDSGEAPVEAVFDWRAENPPAWRIRVETVDDTALELTRGGAQLTVDGRVADVNPAEEYDGIYDHFAALIAAGASDVDLRPFTHVADAFMLGRRHTAAPFHE